MKNKVWLLLLVFLFLEQFSAGYFFILRKINQKKRRLWQIVCISGEAHLWHEENIGGIQYYIVDRYLSEQKRFAIFEWTKDGFNLNRFAIER